MKIKRIVCVIFAIIMIFLVTGCSRCSRDEKFVYTSGIFETISNGEILLYEEIDVEMLKGVVIDQVEFTSSNTSIVQIEKNKLFAIGVGDVVISAKYGELTQEQNIKVIDNGSRPKIDSKDVGLINGNSITLTNKVGWGDNYFVGASFNYSSDNPQVVEVNGNVLTAKSLGIAKITVTANYKGVQVATSNFNCKVNANEGIVLDYSSYNLFISESVKGYHFDKELDLNARVYENGQLVQGASVLFEIEDSNVAVIENGVIKAKALGSTYLVGSYTNGEKTLKTKQIPVTVSIPVINDNTDVVVDKGLSLQVFDGQNIFGLDTNVGKIVNDEDGSEIVVTDNAIKTDLFSAGEYSYTVYNEQNTMANSVNLIVAEYVVYDKEDLLNIASDENVSKYIAIVNDIDFEGDIYKNAHSTPGAQSSAFTGVLNGLGHTIKNIAFVYASEGYKGQNYLGYSGGLFSFAGDCTFKNLCMENVELFGWNSAPLFYRSSGVVNVDNVYIHSTFTNTAMQGAGGLFAFCFSGQVAVSNSIIISENLTLSDKVKLNNGAICGRLNGVFSVNDTYIISDGDICSKQSDYHNKPEAANSLSILYLNFEEFEMERSNGNIITDEFNHYWDLTKDVPTFKTNS